MFPMPPEYMQVRDVEGVLHLINRWMIARAEVRGAGGALPMRRTEPYSREELEAEAIDQDRLQVEVVCQAAGTVLLAGEEALNFLRRFREGLHLF
jgi:hypothetical protein